MNAPARAHRMDMTLEDRYKVPQGWLYMTGMQALVRLPLQQKARDEAAGFNTGGYISGYRGSPLGRYDLELWAAESILKPRNIVFRAGVNEDLAATALWGSQYVGLFPGAKVDGVFGIWYGKGPGVDRSGDPLRHANLAGTSPLGGVVALAGDDHGAKSSTVANYSDLNFVAAGIPVLYPANAQELLDFGLHGIAMSRYSGCWVGMKVVTDVVEGGGSVYVGPDSPVIVMPEKPADVPGGLNSRAVDIPLPQEERLWHHKLPAVLVYARANGLNRIAIDPPQARIGVVAAGKAWQDLRQALVALGIDEARARDLGLRVLKIGLVWPLDPEIVREFAKGLQTIIVAEEKRPLVEEQIRSALYGTANPPAIHGKHNQGAVFDANPGPRLFPNAGEITPAMIADAIRQALMAIDPALDPTPAVFDAAPPTSLAAPAVTAGGTSHTIVPVRAPTFCSGCPHARSTKLPDGSRALAGIGCHSTAFLQDPTRTTTVSHMGGEGVMWLGQQPFTSEKHVFANLGDGTLFHSGFMAVRQAVAAHVPITYKVLYNGFVSMTGGQKVDGEMTVPGILAQFAAEGVGKMAVVTDEPQKYEGVTLPAGVKVHPRDELDAVQRDFREYPDVSVIVYDQPCATERRRLRKRGKWADPDRRTFINSAVCEGCGDCGKVSNCLSVEPLETELGRKRRINQSSCNKDMTCVEGFCPSFVTVEGARLRKRTVNGGDAAATASPTEPTTAGVTSLAAARPSAPAAIDLPEPVFEAPQRSYAILITGIGGTGVVTIGQTLAVAAHLEGWYSSNLDVTGLSQKYGSVLSHVKLAPEPQMLHATRIAAGEADAIVGCDLIVSAGDEAIARIATGRTGGVICTDMVPTSDFARNPDWSTDPKALFARLDAAAGGGLRGFDALRLANALMGDSIYANMMLLGACWQLGRIPLSLGAIERAIELNGVAPDRNRAAFNWGRRAVLDLDALERAAAPAAHTGARILSLNRTRLQSLDDVVNHRTELLRQYRNRRYAKRYAQQVERISAVEAAAHDDRGRQALAMAVARNLAKLLAHKDEFEVARLYTSPEFQRELAQTFEDGYKLRFHVAGGPFGKRDKVTGKLQKTEVGPWLMTAFKWLARVRFVRGTVLDPFRNSDERKLAQRLLTDYEADLALIESCVNADNFDAALELAGWPERVRGYGHVREASAEGVRAERERLRTALSSPSQARARAAA